jgi:hypothetical protein
MVMVPSSPLVGGLSPNGCLSDVRHPFPFVCVGVRGKSDNISFSSDERVCQGVDFRLGLLRDRLVESDGFHGDVVGKPTAPRFSSSFPCVDCPASVCAF